MKTIIIFPSEYAMKELEYYYEERTRLFSSMDTERAGGTELIIHKPLSDETITEILKDFSIVSILRNGLITTPTYTETVLEEQDGVRIVTCSNNGLLSLYRVETVPGVAYTHRVAYQLDVAVMQADRLRKEHNRI